MATGQSQETRDDTPLATRYARRAFETERRQRRTAITRLEACADGEVTDEQRAIVADLARSLTTTLAPVAIETLRLTRDDSRGDSPTAPDRANE